MSSLAPQAVRVRTSAGWRDVALMGPPGPGGLLYANRVAGAYEGTIGPFAGPAGAQTTWRDAAGTLPLQLQYTPPVDAWAEVTYFLGLVGKTDAAYHYLCAILNCSPADADGISAGYDYATQHVSVDQYLSRLVHRLFKLNAGTTYTFLGQNGNASGGNWTYYAGVNQMWLDLKVWARGTVLPLGVPQYVTSLPATPYDGQEVYYSPVAGVVWHLRYNAASASAYKWECLGGAPLEAAVAADQTFTANGTWVDAATAGPTITVPRAGDYDISSSSGAYYAGQTAANQILMGVTCSSGTWDGVAAAGTTIGTMFYTSGGFAVAGGSQDTIRGISAGGTLKMQYQALAAAGGTAHTRWRLLRAMPIRIA